MADIFNMNTYKLKSIEKIFKAKLKINLDSILGVLLLFISLFFIFYLVPNHIEAPRDVDNIMMSPRFIPLVTGWSIFILSIFLFIQGVRHPKEGEKILFFDTSIIRWLLMLSTFIIYTFLFEYLGAIASAFIASACLLLANYINKISIYFLMLVFPVIIYLLFVYLLNVPLPVGDIWR